MTDMIGNQQERRESDRHWLAGVFDGEGCITIVKGNVRRTGRFTLGPNIAFVTSSPVILDEFIRILKDNGCAFYVDTRGPSHIGTKLTSRISICGMQRARRFLAVFLPYLRGKRPEGELVNTYIESRILVPLNMPYRECDLAIHRQLRDLHGYRTRESSETTRKARKGRYSPASDRKTEKAAEMTASAQES